MLEINYRGLVVSKFGSVSAFARAIGWSRRKARAIVLKEQEMTISEAERFADTLGVDRAEDFTDLFLPGRYPRDGTKG